MAEMDLSSLMQQAQALQTKYARRCRNRRRRKPSRHNRAAGWCGWWWTARLRVRKIEIDAAIVAANDKAMLEDLIVVAVNDGMARAQKMLADEMGKLGPLGGHEDSRLRRRGMTERA